MPLVGLQHTNAVCLDLPAERSWSLLAPGQEIGSCRVTVPYGSKGDDPTVINEDGGSLLWVADEDGCGHWRGIVTGVEFDQQGIQLTASQTPILLTQIPVALTRNYDGVPAGVMARAAIRAAAAAGASPLVPGTISEGGPLLAMAFEGQYAWDVLAELIAQSGHELTVSVDLGGGDTLSWGPPDLNHFGTLTGGADFFAWKRGSTVLGRLSRVTVSNGSRWYQLTSGDAAALSHWPAGKTIKDTSFDARQLRQRAEQEMAGAGVPVTTVSGRVPRAKWGIREGDLVEIVLARGNFPGTLDTCRVLQREISDPDWMDLTLQVLDQRTTVALVKPVPSVRVKWLEMLQRR